MSQVPIASVVVTSYNYEPFLTEAIESALSQTYPVTEVIVVDDGSTDGSLAIIEGYGNRIIPVLKGNAGQASAFNAGFAVSRGDVVVFLDSDDVLLPTAVAQAVTTLSEQGTVKVHWPLWEISEEGVRTGALWPAHPLPEGDLREELIRHGVGDHDWPPTSGNAWARRFLAQVLPISEAEYRTCPDIYLGLLARVYGRIKKIDEPQSLYRVHHRNNMKTIRFIDELRRQEASFAALHEHLSAQGVEVEPEVWRRNSWPHRLECARETLAAVVPQQELLVLVDEDDLRAELGAGRRTLPFLEGGGEYWGAPSDDETAIRELERLHVGGASFVAFAWPAFWWLEYYPGMTTHLRSRYRCVVADDNLVIFDLRGPGP